MYALMEYVNGTLAEWDKTHNVKMYTNINNQSTTVAFSYYPQFWLPTNQRPVFDKALFNLIKRYNYLFQMYIFTSGDIVSCNTTTTTTIIWMLTVNVYIIVIYDVITVYYKCILLYSPLNSYLYVHGIVDFE